MLKASSLVILLTLLFSVSCKKQYPIPSDTEINSVVAAIVDQQELRTYANVKAEHLFVRSHLDKLPVLVADSIKNVGLRQVDILLLENFKHFNKDDEKYIFFQNDVLKDFALHNVKSPYELTGKKPSEKDISEWNYYYQFTIPIFSADHNTAFVEVTFTCYGGKCGSCDAVFLKKINGKWKIVKTIMLWIA